MFEFVRGGSTLSNETTTTTTTGLNYFVDDVANSSSADDAMLCTIILPKFCIVLLKMILGLFFQKRGSKISK